MLRWKESEMRQKSYNDNGTVFGFALLFVLGFALASNEFVLKSMGYSVIPLLKELVVGLF